MQINELELFKACHVLFGGQLDISREFLEYIQWTGVKSAYRKKVRETHPDGAAQQGELVQRQMADEFRSVQKAYENLKNFLEARDKGLVYSGKRVQAKANHRDRKAPTSSTTTFGNNQRTSKRHRRKAGKRPFGGFSHSREKNNNAAGLSSKRPATSSLYKGPLPNRKLLFGHFLYYSGLINWRTIVKALAWQKNNRPRVGELGKRVGWLTDSDVEQIIKQRRGMESFGQSAVHHQFLNSQQLKALIDQQKRLQRRLGEFFIAHKIFSPDQMESLALECRRHNDQYSL